MQPLSQVNERRKVLSLSLSLVLILVQFPVEHEQLTRVLLKESPSSAVWTDYEVSNSSPLFLSHPTQNRFMVFVRVLFFFFWIFFISTTSYAFVRLFASFFLLSRCSGFD